MASETRSQLLARLRAQRRKAGIGEFKKKSSKKSAKRKKSTSSRKRSVNKMARKKTTKRRSSNSGGITPVIKAAVGGFLYGIARQPIQQATAGFLGGVSDELGMLLVTGGISMFAKGQIKSVAMVGVSIEASKLAQNFNFGGLGSKTTSSVRIIG